MRTYQKLHRLPLGSIRAEGFLKHQMQIGKDGICGHLHELEPKLIADPYVNKKAVAEWKKADQSGWDAEISGNYWTGYIQYAFTLRDPEMMETAIDWVNSMLKKQKPDGYLGTYYEENARIYEDYNAWGTSCAMRGLIAFYEATGRKDVLEAVHRCMLWFCEKWAGEQKTSYGGPMIIEPMMFVYYHTGDQRLVEFAEDYLDYVCRHDIFHNSYKAMLSDEFHYCSNHTGAGGTGTRIPALVYTATGNEDYLKATVNMLEKIRRHSVHLSGSPVSMSEYFGPVGATTETEYCSYAFYNQVYAYLNYITGETRYGDYIEEMFYNGAQGARKKDEKAIAYLNAPNQIRATMKSSTGVGDMQVYAPCYPVACCPVNAVVVLPEFVRTIYLRDSEDNIYVPVYGPSSLHYKDIAITQTTHYPFRNNVLFTVNSDRAFALHLKIPHWTHGYTLRVNGAEYVAKEENGYAVIEQQWKQGDTVEIVFKPEIEVITVDDCDYAAKFPLAIRRGVLLYAYHIPERWKPIPGRPITPLPEDWSWYEARPVYQEADTPDPHDQIGLRRNQFNWNIALDPKLSPADITVEELPENGYVWSNPMIRLHTYCYKAPYLCAPYEQKTFEPFGQYQYVTEKLPLVLEPYGCTNLRITYFPKAKLD